MWLAGGLGAVLIFAGGYSRVMEWDKTPELPRWAIGVLLLSVVLYIGFESGFAQLPGLALLLGILLGMLMEKSLGGEQDDEPEDASPTADTGE